MQHWSMDVSERGNQFTNSFHSSQYFAASVSDMLVTTAETPSDFLASFKLEELLFCFSPCLASPFDVDFWGVYAMTQSSCLFCLDRCIVDTKFISNKRLLPVAIHYVHAKVFEAVQLCEKRHHNSVV